MDTVEDLVAFIDSKEVNSQSLRRALEDMDQRRLRIIAIKILDWMKSQYRIGQLRHLRLRKDYTWCNDLRHIIETHQFFHEMLTIEDEGLTFASHLDNESRMHICAKANQLYNPPLMT